MRKTFWFTIGSIAILLAVTGWYRAMVYAAHGPSETVRNANGSILGYIEGTSQKQTIYNKNRKIIGYVDSNGTYDANKKKILISKQPGILFCEYLK
jgi:hypothetical protein